MHVISARNVNGAFAQGLEYLLHFGEVEASRNGKVLVAPSAVTTVYERPWERVLFSPLRDANPVFHLMEALWMLGGRRDVAFPAQFNKRFVDYSDDGVLFNAAYGYRWRSYFDRDQLADIIGELRRSPESRRCVLGMWDPYADLGSSSRDIPCNTNVYFDRRHGKLNMTVCNRSNDIIWGAYGANVVHMSMMQEYIASALDCPMGVYRQVSNNYHAYTDVYPVTKFQELANDALANDEYFFDRDGIFEEPHGNFTNAARFDRWNADLLNFLNGNLRQCTEEFFIGTAIPMYTAWVARKQKQSNGLSIAESIVAPDWRIACVDWILRREK
jgi:hypothetical protein